MNKDMIQVLLDLNENNQERNRVDPRKQLAVLYREVKELRNTLSTTEKKLAYMDAEDQERKTELDKLITSKPGWASDIHKAKDRMVRQQGLTLKDMLEIQQEVVRLEEEIYYGEARIVDLRGKTTLYRKNRDRLVNRIKELKADYNQHAEIYNQEKQKSDELMGSFSTKEDAMLEHIPPEARSVYRAALKANPDSPVAMLDGEICNGCRIGLSKQILKKVNQGEQLVFCENCMRIIVPVL